MSTCPSCATGVHDGHLDPRNHPEVTACDCAGGCAGRWAAFVSAFLSTYGTKES